MTVDNSGDKWAKLEQVLRAVLRDELSKVEVALKDELGRQVSNFGKKPQVSFSGGKWFGISVEQNTAWAAAYPSVDIPAELNRAAAWITSNPLMAPKSQFARFINAWLSKEHSRLSIRSIPTRNETPGPGRKLCSYCERVATNSPNRIWACDDHTHDAMDQKPAPMFKNAVTAKPVAGG